MQSAYDWLIRIDEQLAAAEMRIDKHKRRIRELQKRGVDVTQALELDRQMGELVRILHARRIAIIEQMAKQKWTHQSASAKKVPLEDIEAPVLTEIHRARREAKMRIFTHLTNVMRRLNDAQLEGKTGFAMREVEREVFSAVSHAAKAFEQRLTTAEIAQARARLTPSLPQAKHPTSEIERGPSNVVVLDPWKKDVPRKRSGSR